MGRAMSETWPEPFRLNEIGRGMRTFKLEPDDQARAAIAKRLGLQSLPRLTAQVTLGPWLDGVEIQGRFEAVVEQVCGVSLEAFEQPLSGELDVRAVPAGSPNAPAESLGEVVLEPDAPDPPDVLESESIDLREYLVEHLALEVDPFPRKPDAVFEYTPDSKEESPFAVLKALKANDD
jgi:uncharacterized metal-binding protein YceD (DUF177 family)